MRLTVLKTPLLKALSHAQSVVEKRHTLPILGHVLLSAEGGILTLQTTDMELNLIENVEAVVEEAGSLTVAASMFFDIIRKIDAETVTLFIKENQIHIHAGRSKFKISYLNASDFPKLSFGELPITFELTADQLKQLLDKPRFAMSTEETRYYLNGIYWHIVLEENFLRSVATDSHRLAYTQIPAPEGSLDMPGIIISRKTVNEVRKLLDESEKKVTVKLSAQRIEFYFNQASLSSRLIDGSFPDYLQAVPYQNNRLFYVPTKDFTSAVDRVATVVNDKIRTIKMELKDQSVNLSALSAEMGSAQEDLPVAYEGTDAIEIGFNAKYLLDIAQQIDDEETSVALFDGNSPALIKGANDNDSLYVIMPMRI